MLRITVEMVPWGEESLKYKLAELHIVNDGTASDGSGDSKFGNYDCRFYDLHSTQPNFIDGNRHPWLVTHIRRWPRSNTVWELVAKSLRTLNIKLKPLKEAQ